MTPKSSRRAFSLIECVLALGIASSLLLTAVALLPVGLEATRAAERKVIEATIVESLRSQIEKSSLIQGTWYFDDRGADTTSHVSNAVFIARVELSSETPIINESGPAMRRLRILISDCPFSAFGDASRTHVYPMLLPKLFDPGA